MSTFSDQAIQDLKSSLDYMTNEKSAWTDAWKLYNNERTTRGYIGTADTFDPMSFTVVETKLANTFGTKPRVVYWPTQREQYTETRILTKLFDHTWDINRMSAEILPFGRSLFVTGNATIWADWDADLDTDGWIKLRHVPIADNIIDPTSNSPMNDTYGGYRYLTNIDELKDAKVYNPSSDDWDAKYTNLDQIKLWTDGKDEETDQMLKDQLDGAVVDGNAKQGLVEVTVLYYVKGKHKGKKIELANRNVAIYEDDSPYQREAKKKTVRVAQYDDQGECQKDEQGQPVFVTEEVTLPEIRSFIPRAFQRDYTDGSRRLGKGEIYFIADLQELLNDTINQRRDNATHQINARLFIDPKFKDQIPKLKNLPNSVYAIPPNAIKWEEKPDTAQSADAEIGRIKEQIRTTSAIDEVTAGLRPDGKHTATEINTQVNQAGQRFGITLQSLENEAYTDLAQIIFNMIQLFVDEERVIRLTGRQGVEWLEYNPDLYWGNYEPNVQLDQTAKAQNADEIKRIQGAAQFFINNPYVDQKELSKLVATRLFQFDEDEAEQIMVKNMPDMQAQQAAMQNQQQQLLASGQLPAQPGQMQKPEGNDKGSLIERLLETIDVSKLPVPVQAQLVEQQLGVQWSGATPDEQKLAVEAHKIQQGQVSHEMTHHQKQVEHALNLHKSIMDTHAQVNQQDMAARQQDSAEQNQQFTQEQAQQAAQQEAKV